MLKNLKYDLLYLYKTYKFIIFPVVALIFAILSPLTAKYINEILAALTSTGGPVISLPDPTVIDSYSQYLSNLYEIFLIVVIFISASMFIRDKTKGYLPLILSKPINRTKYILSKFASLLIVIFISLIIGGVFFSIYTYLLFGEVSVSLVIVISLIYLVYVIFIMSIVLLFTQLFNNYAATAILSFVLYIFFNILGGFEVFVLDYLPGRLMYRITEILLEASNTGLVLWNIIISLSISATLIVISISRFKVYDLK
jgi:ABC-2 type transport system permease protein